MTAGELLEEVVRVQPEFRAYWEGENYFRRADGGFNVGGIFCHFTRFFQERHARMTVAEIQAIAALVDRCEEDINLRTAAYTCFLENIAGEGAEQSIAPFLSKRAQGFLEEWRASGA